MHHFRLAFNIFNLLNQIGNVVNNIVMLTHQNMLYSLGVYCPKAPGLENGYVEASTGRLSFGDTVTYKCFQGFTPKGNTTVTCEDSGQWSMLPTCESK